MPAIKFFGQLAPGPVYPSTVPIPDMTPSQLWASYIRPMGAGAVAASGLITLMKTMPTILAALRSGLKDIRAQSGGSAVATSRIERDLPMKLVVLGSLVIVADRKSTRLNSSHLGISYAVFCLKKKNAQAEG